jgi:hypothetical protein
MDLTESQSKRIYDLFKDYMKAGTDVKGRQDLNRYLNRFEDIRKRHTKIIYSDAAVFKDITNYDIIARSNEFKENEIKRTIQLFAETPDFQKCRETLEKNNYVIVTGVPGSGKTTIAQMLCYEYISEKYELVYIYDNIKDLERLYKDDNKKQVFYFDDFLGHNSFEIANARLGENIFIRYLTKIKNNPHKRLVFTTRTFILKDAFQSSEKFQRLNLQEGESTILLESYSSPIKRKILQNHLLLAHIPEEKKSLFLTSDLSDFIVDHIHYSPRSIEYITDPSTLHEISLEELPLFVKKNFGRPDKIWQHAFDNQINRFDRILLLTFMSLGYSVNTKELELAYNYRIQHEQEYFESKAPLSPFVASFRKLEESFLKIEKVDHNSVFTLRNHSLKDFLTDYLKHNPLEVKKLAEYSIFVEQLKNIYPLFEDFTFKPPVPEKLINRIRLDQGFEQAEGTAIESVHSYFIFFLYKYLDGAEKIPMIISRLGRIQSWEFIADSVYDAYQWHMLVTTVMEPELVNSIQARGLDIFISLLATENDFSRFNELIELGESKFSVDFKNSLVNEEEDFWTNHFVTMINDHIENKQNELMYYNRNQYADKVEELKREMYDFAKERLRNYFGFASSQVVIQLDFLTNERKEDDEA